MISDKFFYRGNVENKNDLEESDIFENFKSKKLKLYLALFMACLGAISNFSAVKYQIMQSRFDMLGFKYLELYAFGVTICLDLSIIIFYLMRAKKLVRICSFSAISISLYANILLHLQTAGGTSFFRFFFSLFDPSIAFNFFVSIIVATLPLIILTQVMDLLMKEIDGESGVEGIK
jgi:hypothetical protein